MADLRALIRVRMGLAATYATAGLFPSTVGFVDESSRLLSLNITRGRDRELEAIQPGRAVLRFDNYDGRFSPTSGGASAAGVPGGYASNLSPMRPVKITAAFAEGAEYGEAEYRRDSYGGSGSYAPLFRGPIESIRANLRRDGPQIAEVALSDGMQTFGDWRVGFPATYPSEPSSAIVARALNEATEMWATSQWDLGPGELTPASYRYTVRHTVMDLIRSVVESESRGAAFYIAKDGRATFRGAANRDSVPASVSRENLSDADIWDFQAESDIRDLYTQITAIASDGTEQSLISASGLFRYGQRTLDINATHRTPTQALALASGLRRVRSGTNAATVGLPSRPHLILHNNSRGMLSQILGRELNEVVQLETSSTGGPLTGQQGAFNRTFWIDSMDIKMDSAGGVVTADWGLSVNGLAGTSN